MNICFISNFSKTHLYRSIADTLRQTNPNIRVHWILTDPKYLPIVANDPHLLIDWTYSEKNSPAIADLKINELIVSDRILNRNKDTATRYLTHIQKPLFDFFTENQIAMVFGERTW